MKYYKVPKGTFLIRGKEFSKENEDNIVSATEDWYFTLNDIINVGTKHGISYYLVRLPVFDNEWNMFMVLQQNVEVIELE